MVSGLTRVPDWRAKLSVATDSIQATQFVWGWTDCFVGILKTVSEAVVGESIVRPWEGSYSSSATAVKALKKTGFSDLIELVDSILPRIRVDEADVGDIAGVFYGDAFGASFGVFLGEHILAYSPSGQPALFPREVADLAWKMG